MASYIRQSTFSDGDTITAALFNNEFNQLVNAFNVSSGHTHDGSTTGDGGPISNLFSNALVFGTNAESDIAITFNAASNDGVLTWKEDEDYFEFSDDLLIATTEKIQFRDTAIYINSSADGQLDLVADTEIQIAATTIDMNGAADISGNLAVGGNLTVTGNATISGNLTFGDAASDTVAFSADVASNLLPSADNTYDLGASGSEWKDLYVDGVAYVDAINFNGTAITSTAAELNILDGVTSTAAELNILDGVTATTAELNIMDGVTSTAAELNILDGVTSTAAELNILDGVTSTAAELNILDGVTASATDINLIDGITNGTVIASKAIITDSNKDITGGRNITISGELDAATLDISGDADIDGTLEADAITIGGVTLAETISDTVGAMVSSNTETNITVTYEDSDNTLDFVIGTLNQDTTGTADNITVSANNSTDETVYPIFVDGATGSQGAESDTGLTYNPSSGNLTIGGQLAAATLDISGDVDVDGTLEADAITVNGTTLAETISDTIGAMVTSNTESGITVAYDDSDNTLDFTVGTLNQDTTGTASKVIVSDTSADTNFPVVFHDEGTGNTLLDDTGALRYNPSSGTLLIPAISLSGNADFNGDLDVDGTTNLDVVDIDGAVDMASTLQVDGAITFSSTLNGVDILADATNFVDSILISQNASTGTLSSASNNTGLGDSVFAALTSGHDNTVIGKDAGKAITTGEENVIVGHKAGDALTDADYNVAVGRSSLTSDTLGSKSTALGHGTLNTQNFTTATDSHNVAVGYNAMALTTTGIYNTAVGSTAMDSNTTGSSNNAFGYGALTANTTAAYNNAFGINALAANTTGGSNSAFGHTALDNNTTGSNNVAVGANALDANTTADNNTAVGKDALLANTTGTRNAAVGTFSLDSNTTANDNTGMGYGTLASNTTGAFNTAVGSSALVANTTGANNVAVGEASLDANTTGAENTSVGVGALGANTTASNNTAVGRAALINNTTGEGNTCIGSLSLDANTTGDLNTALGYNALTANTTADGNTAVGNNSQGANTTGANNTSVGNQALAANTTGAGNTAVGVSALAANTTASNNTTLGYVAGGAITTGAGNVVIGNAAGAQGVNLTTGTQNVIVGQHSRTSASGSSNQIILGFEVTGAGDDNFTFGKSSTDSNIAFGATSITAPSDIRLKEDIQDEEVGLDFINDLRPVTFLWKKEKDIPSEMKAYKEGSEERTMNGKYNHGFIAQEVKQTIDSHNLKEGFDMWAEDEADGRQRVAPNALMSVMVKAVQELSTQVDELKAKLNEGE